MSESYPYRRQDAEVDIATELIAEREPHVFIEAVEQRYSMAVRTIVDAMCNTLPHGARVSPESPNDAFWSEAYSRDGQSNAVDGRYITLPMKDSDYFLVAGYRNRQLTPELPGEIATDIDYYGTEWEVTIARPDARLQGVVPVEQVALWRDLYRCDKGYAYAPWINLQSPDIEGGFATITRRGSVASESFAEDSSKLARGIAAIMQKLSQGTET